MARRQSAPRLEFEAAAIYEYPEHLRPWLEALPRQPGVYLFHGESDTLPLYIGKSVNIRSRVLSHLRTPDEAAMLRQSRRITWQRTAGELGALLLEAQLIKEQQPLFNKRLRQNRQLCSLRLADARPQVVYASELDFFPAKRSLWSFCQPPRGAAGAAKNCRRASPVLRINGPRAAQPRAGLLSFSARPLRGRLLRKRER
ncbi:excinuclease cho (excinuclease ABC alternative C subunit) [Klebsiella michiganensis]|uniref:Excinuclease cho n=1 Tax=Klebsiella michiganensis TaxID=1134687 RepID=A0A7H4LUL3_9ENTR|nr:excinuclease cho (excinuclease ABC alternative C subunit) [Klebsiella michiganensis]